MDNSFGFISRKSPSNTSSQRFSPMLSPKIFMVLNFAVVSMTHLYLNFLTEKSLNQNFLFACKQPIVQEQFEMSIHFPLNYFCFFIKDQFAILM
jgi:hypothetical protein